MDAEKFVIVECDNGNFDVYIVSRYDNYVQIAHDLPYDAHGIDMCSSINTALVMFSDGHLPIINMSNAEFFARYC